MKCKKCGTECRWLYYPRSDYPSTYYEDHMIQTDYWICPECDTIYKQWIEPIIHRDEVEVDSLGETKKGEKK